MIKKTIFIIQLLTIVIHFNGFAQNERLQVNTFNTPLYTLFSPLSFARNTSTSTTAVPSITQTATGNVLNMTNATTCLGVSASFNNTFNPSKDWQLKFTYTLTSAGNGGSNADGIAVAIHNDSRGTGAVGGSGSSLGCDVNDNFCNSGVTAIRNAMLWEFGIFSAASNNGATLKSSTNLPVVTIISGPTNANPIVVTTNVPIDITMRYTASSSSLVVTLTDGTNTKTFSYTINLSLIVGTNAYLSFTGGTGGTTSVQNITKVFMMGYPQ